MSFNNPYYVGIANVGSYQVSGMPYATSSIAAPAVSGVPTVVSFPWVTQRIIVRNTNSAAPLRVAFSSNGAKGTNYYVIPAATSNTNYPESEFRVKVNAIYLLSDLASPTSASVFAELTNIDSNLLINSGPSGSNWSGSIGVG
jgi:hypothetical protein